MKNATRQAIQLDRFNNIPLTPEEVLGAIKGNY
jgi:hypothetical protein